MDFVEIKPLILLIVSSLLIRQTLVFANQGWAKSYSQTISFLLLPIITYVITKTISGNIKVPLIDALPAVKALIEIFPLPSLATIALAVFAEVAVVALLLTLPDVEIVAKFASVIPAEPDKLEFVNPVTEIVPALIEIPAPAVKVACLALNTS